MSLNEEIATNYYATTAARGHSPTREYYDSWMPSFGQRLLPWIPQDRATPCLDLACGCGEFVYALEQLGFTNVSGVDLCEEELQQARRIVQAKLVCADVCEYLHSAAASSLGFISALNLLEHLPKDNLPQLLRDVRRVLRPGGTFIAIVPNGLSPFSGVARYWDITHQTAFTPNNFHQLAALTGFSARVDFAEVGPIPHGLKSGVRWTLWQGLRLAIMGWFLIEGGSVRGSVFTQDMMVRLNQRQT